VFAQAWRTAPNYESARGSVAGWLLMIARARAIDRLRSRRARHDDGTANFDAIPSSATPVSDRLITDEQAGRVRDALMALPVDQKAALELAYFEGCTHTEIAERLHAPLGTVKTRIRAALATLRRSVRP
jgi:RNA polymerase sigma-70 factor (ECF subfamily)